MLRHEDLFCGLKKRRQEDAASLEQRPKLRSQGYGAGAATDHLWQEGLRLRPLTDV